MIFIESGEQYPVEVVRGGEIMPERLLDNDAGSVSAIGVGELFHYGAKQRGWDRQIVCWPLRRTELLANGLKRRPVGIVAVDVAQEPRQFVERCRIEAAMFLQAISCPRLELLERPAGLCDANDGGIEVAAFQHGL